MADSKITGLSADTAPTGDDLLVSVNDPLGTPANKKVKVSDLMNQALVQNPYKFRVRRVAAYTPGSSGAFVVIPYDTKDYDTSSNVDVVTNKGRFTAPVSGFYHFNGRWSGSGTNQTLVALYKNGALYQRGTHMSAGGAVVGNLYSDDIQLTAGDYIEMTSFQDAAAAFEVAAGSQAYFSGYLISIT